MTKFKKVFAKLNNRSVVLYYSKDGRQMRHPVGVSISEHKARSGKYLDWDYRNNCLQPSIPMYEVLQRRIDDALARANSIVAHYFEKGVELTPEKLHEELKAPSDSHWAELGGSIVSAYEVFHRIKQSKYKSSGVKESLKDYTSTKHLLNDFNTFSGRVWMLTDINTSFCRQLHDFMLAPHVSSPNTGISYISQGELGPKTCKKRFDIIVQFLEFVHDEYGVIPLTTVNKVKDFRRKNIKVPQTAKVTLTLEEVYQLYDFEFDTIRLRIAADIFVFLCLCGLRFSDYKKFNRAFIRPIKGSSRLVYERTATKTRNSSGESFKIPLCDTVLEILEKYQYCMPVPTKINADIKEALKVTGYFNEETDIIDKRTKTYKKRYQCISLHKGRDTFITNLCQNVPLNELMRYTGHKKLSTLQIYVDMSREVSDKYIDNLNRPNE
jgi:integrase